MPEGPSIVILKEAVQQFTGQEVLAVSGNSTIDINRIKNLKVISFKSWGKHFLICFENFTVRIHFLMFGTYRINERKDSSPRLSLSFSNGEINLYTCSIKLLEGNINQYYDWSEDVMNGNWDPKSAKKKLKAIPGQMICDALLDQNIFSGVGNIIKNEVLYRTYVHPESLTGKIPSILLNRIINECSKYSFEFLEWKKNYVLRNHWLAYTKKVCQRCDLPIQYKRYRIKETQKFLLPQLPKIISMKTNLYIGCSSFYNLYWKKIFYPEDIPASKWFEYYCNYFNTYEINGTFYKFPTLKVMENWYLKTPDDFLFSVKAPKEITHKKKFIGCETLIKDFYSICSSALKEKLGPFLFQFPPGYHYSRENLLFIISQLDLKYENVIEFRHQSWWIPEVWKELAQNNITFCSVSHPQLPETIFTTFPIIYIRLHGLARMFYSSYSTEKLNNINAIIARNRKTKTFLYFNNTAGSAGILNALKIKKLAQS